MKYYVTYHFKSGYGIGFGSAFITTVKPIKTQVDIWDIREHIQEEFDAENVVVLDYKLLEENENE